jgi:hypothetical protein
MMHVFKTDAKLHLTNELKNWTLIITFGLLLFVVLKLFYSLPEDKLLVGIAVFFLLKTGDTITRFHVKEIKIDTQTNQLTFILSSIMSGQKSRIYELREATSELTHNSTLTKVFLSPLTLKILLAQKGRFRINGRYGFTTDTLEEVNHAIKLAAITDKPYV